MELESSQISSIVEKVVKRLKEEGLESPAARKAPADDIPTSGPAFTHGLYPNINAASAAAEVAQKNLVNLSLAKRGQMIEAMREISRRNVEELSREAVAETGLGRYEDKIQKNLLAINKTPGVEILEPVTHTGDHGMTLTERAPYGVIGSITPCTNPTETIICNAIGMVAGGNSVVFNVHPTAKKVSANYIALLNQAIESVGGPQDVLTCVEEPTIQSAQELMKHPGIKLLVVTGGPAVVEVAMQSGKKVIAAGPGNPPVVVDETADIDKAGRDIVNGASLDNNIVCVVEKEIFAIESIADNLKASMKANGAYEAKQSEIRALEKILIEGEHSNRKWIGKDASVILKEIGVNAPSDTRLVLCETPYDHPFVRVEMLLPVIPIVRVDNVDKAIEMAVETEAGCRHTAVMHSKNVESLHKMARACDCSIFVKNAPSYAGLGMGGEGYTSFTIASPTGEGLTTAKHFTRERRCTLAGYFRIV